MAGGGGGEQARAPCHSVPQESHWAHIQSTAARKTLLLGQIKLAVLNLFQLATARLKVPVNVALEDTEAQLDTVSTALSPGQWGWGTRWDIHVPRWLWHQGPCPRRCCSTCRTWLPSVLSCALGSRGCPPDACPTLPACARCMMGVPGCP